MELAFHIYTATCLSVNSPPLPPQASVRRNKSIQTSCEPVFREPRDRRLGDFPDNIKRESMLNGDWPRIDLRHRFRGVTADTALFPDVIELEAQLFHMQ